MFDFPGFGDAQPGASVLAIFKNNPILIPTLILGLWATKVLYDIFLHPLSPIPGPFLAKFSNLWINIRYFRGTWHDDVVQLHKKYGPVVRITPYELSFVDEAALKKLYGHGTGVLKTPWYQTWVVPDLENSFFATQDPSLHRLLRSRVSTAYSMSSVLAMEPFIQSVANKCWAKFRAYSEKGVAIDLSEFVGYFAFDVVGELALSGELGMLEREKDVDGIISSIHDGFYMFTNLGHVIFQNWWISNPLFQFFMAKFGSKEANAMNTFLQWLGMRVDDRMKNGLRGRRKDMMQHFCEMKGLPGQDKVTVKDVITEGAIILGAGADTVTVAILAFLGQLVTNPDAVPRLQEEVDKAYDELGLASKGEDISYNDASKLPYLSAVVKEAMRLHPPIQYQLPRLAPAGGITIGKYYMPEGTHMGISAKTMNRSKDIFGDDADEFRPERWIANGKEDEESIKEQSRLLTTFGMGNRVCIGQNIAMVEILKFAAQFVRHFNLESVNEKVPWVTKSQWFSFQSKFLAKLHVRD